MPQLDFNLFFSDFIWLIVSFIFFYIFFLLYVIPMLLKVFFLRKNLDNYCKLRTIIFLIKLKNLNSYLIKKKKSYLKILFYV